MHLCIRNILAIPSIDEFWIRIGVLSRRLGPWWPIIEQFVERQTNFGVTPPRKPVASSCLQNLNFMKPSHLQPMNNMSRAASICHEASRGSKQHYSAFSIVQSRKKTQKEPVFLARFWYNSRLFFDNLSYRKPHRHGNCCLVHNIIIYFIWFKSPCSKWITWAKTLRSISK